MSIDDAHNRQRRLLAGLQYDHITGGKRRRDFDASMNGRPVERDNAGNHEPMSSISPGILSARLPK